MGKVVNLRQARKRAGRAEAERTAAANRAKHGRTAAQKQKDRAEAQAAAAKLDNLKLEHDDGC